MNFRKEMGLVGILVLFIYLPNISAQDNRQANLKTILEKSRENISKINSARYKAFYRSDDERDDEPVEIYGDIFFKKLSSQIKSEVSVKTKMEIAWINPTDTAHVSLYYNGNQEVSFSDKGKKVRIFNRPAMLAGNIMGNLVDNILTEDGPFKNTLERLSDYKIEDTEQVDGEPCYVLTLYFPDSEYFTDISDTWYISKKDYLPRKHIHRYSYNGKKKGTTLQFENLKANPDLPDSLFTLSTLPEGYEIERPEDRAKKKKPELLDAGTPAPGWTLKNGEGGDVSLRDYRGQIVILDFWGTWCLPCLEAMPELQRIHEKYEGITVLGVSTKEPVNAEPVKFARNRDITYPILLNGEKIIHNYHVRTFPTFYIIGKDGTILDHSEGYGDGTGELIEEVLDGYISK